MIPEADRLEDAFWESDEQSFAPRPQLVHPMGRCPPTGGWHLSLGQTRWSGAEDHIRLTNVAGDARYPWVALLLIIACESLRIREDTLGNNPTPQTKGAIKLVPTIYPKMRSLELL